MAKSAILSVRIIGDATSAIKAMDEVSGKSSGVGSALNTASKYSVAGLAAITGAAVMAGKSASDLEQATGAVSSVFGEYAGEMMKHGEAAAVAVGLSQTEFGNMSSVLGSQLKNMGLSLGESAGKTTDLIGLGSDLAATFGGSTSDAVSALSSLLRGERDPIERYGVSIKQADIDAQKAAMGLSGLSGEAAKNADLQATLALLTSQTADAQGQFARETGSAAGQAQIASAQFENAKAALGEALLPIMVQVSQALAGMATYFQENATWITPLVGAIAALAAGIIVINAVYKTYAAIQAMQTAAQVANNVAWLASPVTWIVLAVIAAIALLVLAVVLIVKHWDQLKAAAVAAFEIIITWIQQAIDWVSTRFQAGLSIITGGFAAFRASVVGVFNTVISWIQQAIQWIADRFSGPIQTAIRHFMNMRDSVVGVFKTIIDWIDNALSWLGELAANAVPGWAKELLGMSTRSMMIRPEVAALPAQQFRARMMVAPEMAGTLTPSSPWAGQATLASSGISAAVSLASFQTPRVSAASNQPTQKVADNRRYSFSFPNYTGDKEELIEWISRALKKLETEKDRTVYA